MIDNSLFEPLAVQPEDLGAFEKKFLRDVADGVVRAVDASFIDRMTGYGLIVVRDRHIRLTRRGRLFCDAYSACRPPFAGSTGKTAKTKR